jgi:molybdopterin/thiamine biosynthesis adenylyltransferase
MKEQRFSRQILAFGEEGQRRVANARVGIIGAGGIGAQIIQGLAYLGVERFLIIDDDVVEESNLNRLVGAFPLDAKRKRPKVDVARRMIRQINPGAEIIKFQCNLRNEKVLEALVERDYIFGCVDNDAARLILAEFSAAFEIPLIDAASEIIPGHHEVEEFGGRVVVARPGDYCVFCANEIDPEIAKIELESPPEKEFREKHGYGLGALAPAPAVISLNGIIANIAITEFLMLVTNMRPANRKVIYKGMRGVATVSKDQKKDTCMVCNYLVGKKDSANIKRYVRLGLPEDLPM